MLNPYARPAANNAVRPATDREHGLLQVLGRKRKQNYGALPRRMRRAGGTTTVSSQPPASLQKRGQYSDLAERLLSQRRLKAFRNINKRDHIHMNGCSTRALICPLRRDASRIDKYKKKEE
eukprot:scaffold299418_cov20-Prasinocladus_malaysianus.AAC.1